MLDKIYIALAIAGTGALWGYAISPGQILEKLGNKLREKGDKRKFLTCYVCFTLHLSVILSVFLSIFFCDWAYLALIPFSHLLIRWY